MPLPSINLTVGRQISFLLPPVYRFLDRQYADQLTNDGRLRLSSFRAFKNHKDEQRGDPSEGSTMLFGHDTSADRSFGIARTVGQNAYILSVALTADKSIASMFGCDSCIEIQDVLEFGALVSGEILGFQGALFGYCLYKEHRMLSTNVKNITLDDFRDDSEKDKMSLDKILKKSEELGGNEEFFLKELRYAPQQEFRFVWFTDRETKDFLDIENPKLKSLANRVF